VDAGDGSKPKATKAEQGSWSKDSDLISIFTARFLLPSDFVFALREPDS
jgi:hypothetical protein